MYLPLNFDIYTVAVFCHSIGLQILGVATLPNVAFYPRKTIEKAKTSGSPPEFCQICIVRQHTKYKDYKPIQKCEDVAARLLRATATCNLTTVTLTQDVAYISIRFLCNSGSRDSSIYFRLGQNPFLDSDSP